MSTQDVLEPWIRYLINLKSNFLPLSCMQITPSSSTPMLLPLLGTNKSHFYGIESLATSTLVMQNNMFDVTHGCDPFLSKYQSYTFIEWKTLVETKSS